MAIDLGAAGASPDGVGDVVEHLFRTESARLTAILTRILGPAHLELAEDSTQEALLAALKHWPVDGVPSNPSAWLLQVARRRALDALRRDAPRAADDDASSAAIEALVAGPGDHEAGEAMADDELRLIFLCCHPAVSRDSRVALTLKLAAGFGVGEIARAFLADETAVAQRLVRAKRALREALAGAPLAMPSAAEIPARLDAVLDVLYLMFNEGHTAHEGTSLLRRDLCHEALRLTELLLTSEATAEPRVHALAALFCFHAARLDARTDAMGALVRLPQQDRTRWDTDLVARGVRHLDDSASGDELTVYHLEAEIAGFHATAPSWEVTEWDRILAAYDLLLTATGSAVVALNRVVAVWHARSAGQALEELDALASRDALQDYHLYHAVRAELLMATGRAKEARRAYEAALELARLEPARDLLRDRIAGLSGGLSDGHVDSGAPRPS
jgi:RNA polymerase sigma-70 factor (ECF subfamily)